MSAHVELDFADDGAITLTARPKKGAEIATRQLRAGRDRHEITVSAGANDLMTHIITITTADVELIDTRELCA